MLCNTVDPNFGNKFKRFLSLEKGRGNPLNRRGSWIPNPLQGFRKSLNALRNNPNRSKPTSLETGINAGSSQSPEPEGVGTMNIVAELSKPRHPKQIMAAILNQIEKPDLPNTADLKELGLAIGYMEMYLARGYSSNEDMEGPIITFFESWFNYVKGGASKAFALGGGPVYTFNMGLMDIAGLKFSGDRYIYNAIGGVRIEFYKDENNKLKMQLLGSYNNNHFGKKLGELNQALQELQSASSKSQNK